MLTSRQRTLKLLGQYANVFAADTGFVDGSDQQLFDQFYARYGLPNAAEKALLSQVGNQSFENIDRFCKSKHSAYIW